MDARQIATDTEHGADALARMAVAALMEAPSKGAAQRLAAARPGMPVIAHRVAMAWQDIDAGRDPWRRLDQEQSALVSHAPRWDRVVTLSRSSTVASLLAARAGRVAVWRSLPGREGGAMVDDLHRQGVAAHVVDDGTGGAVAVLGADALSADGTVWNKVGSARLAAASERVYVAAATAKITRHDVAWLERHASPRGIFEAVPADAVDGYITEEGLLASGDLAAKGRPYWDALERLRA